MIEACRVHVGGIVQGVGFRLFVYQTARRHAVSGWVRNAASGVEIHAEGMSEDVRAFLQEVTENAPAAAQVCSFKESCAAPERLTGFRIRKTVK